MPTTTYEVVSGYADTSFASVSAACALRLYRSAQSIGTSVALYEGTARDGLCAMAANGSGDRVDAGACERFWSAIEELEP